MNALLSVKPEFANRILDGTKKYEYRKRVFSKPVERIFVYSSSPTQRIVGEIELVQVHCAAPSSIWRRTRLHSGISRRYFLEYFSGRDVGYAIEVGAVHPYSRPVDPFTVLVGFVPPQSYMYVCDADAGEIRYVAAGAPPHPVGAAAS